MLEMLAAPLKVHVGVLLCTSQFFFMGHARSRFEAVNFFNRLDFSRSFVGFSVSGFRGVFGRSFWWLTTPFWLFGGEIDDEGGGE
jgi:hypothetical protein